MKATNTGTTALRKSLANSPRMKSLIDDVMFSDEQAVLNMMVVLEGEIKRTVAEIPAIVNLLSNHLVDGDKLDNKWQVVYQEDEETIPMVVYRGQHGIMDTVLMMHSDGFVRVRLNPIDGWWEKSRFDKLDRDMITRVDVAEKLSPILAAILLEAGETMMALTIEAGGIKSFGVIDQEPRPLSEREWTDLQHDRGYSSCSCGRDHSRGADMMSRILGGGGMFGGMARL